MKNLTRLIQFLVLVLAASCHSAFAKDRQAHRLEKGAKATKSSKAYPTMIPTTCTDAAFFEDVTGRTCYFRDVSRLCEVHIPNRKGVIPSEACCICGGGKHVEAYTYKDLKSSKKKCKDSYEDTGWTDNEGYSCAQYDIAHREKCGAYADHHGTNDKTANEVCCGCIERDTSSAPSNVPRRLPSDEDGQARRLKKSPKATKSPKAYPTMLPTTCKDAAFFEDVTGRTCSFKDVSLLCEESIPNIEGVVSSEACCICGGGKHVEAYTYKDLKSSKKKCKDSFKDTHWTDDEGYSCAQYNIAHREKCGAYAADHHGTNGKTANEVCCGCIESDTSGAPSSTSSNVPSVGPSLSMMPSDRPSSLPSNGPSFFPSSEPSILLSDEPSILPSKEPSILPSDEPSILPSDEPSILPSDEPSLSPSDVPSILPSNEPSNGPSAQPSVSNGPSDKPSFEPSVSISPSDGPSSQPSLSVSPSGAPSSQPSMSMTPSTVPSSQPSMSMSPSNEASNEPSLSPSVSAAPSLLECERIIDCNDDVTTFSELQCAVEVCSDIKLGSGTIIFTGEISLVDKTLTFTCPNSGCVLDADKKFGIFTISTSSEGSTISFDGITFKDGDSRFGGAIHIREGSSVTITACKFIGNNGGVEGGAIYNYRGSMIITESEFKGNTAGYGGGVIWNHGGSMVITESEFEGNTARVKGGSISNFSNRGKMSITGSNFVGNTAANAGAISNENGGFVNITESEFKGNTAGGKGGAIHNVDGNVFITESEFEGNTAPQGGNNIFNGNGDVTCNDGANTFKSSGGGGRDDSDGNFPTGLCTP
eukprot:scaffold744_cov170-Chaetoceros_neogracile.AAC.6